MSYPRYQPSQRRRGGAASHFVFTDAYGVGP